MEYLSPKQCAKNWGISERAVQILCSNNKIIGAKQVGRSWLIPISATKPVDGRTKQAKEKSTLLNYHFPIFIFSELYPSVDILNKEENELRKAQIMYLEGHYEDSIVMCHHLIAETNELHIKIGAYITIAYETMLLGLSVEYKTTISILNTLIENAEYNKEDYKLIYAGLIYHLSWDPKPLFELDIAKLSIESLPYYQYIMTLSNVINGMPISTQTIATLSAFCKFSELNKIDPLYLIVTQLIAFIHFKQGNSDTCESLVKSACNFAIKNGWINSIAKHYSMLSTIINNCLDSEDPSILQQIKHRTSINVINWRLISKVYNGGTIMDNIPIEFFDITVLLSKEKSDKEIASIKNMPIKTIRLKIEELLEITHLTTRNDLIAFSKQQLGKFKL